MKSNNELKIVHIQKDNFSRKHIHQQQYCQSIPVNSDMNGNGMINEISKETIILNYRKTNKNSIIAFQPPSVNVNYSLIPVFEGIRPPSYDLASIHQQFLIYTDIIPRNVNDIRLLFKDSNDNIWVHTNSGDSTDYNRVNDVVADFPYDIGDVTDLPGVTRNHYLRGGTS